MNWLFPDHSRSDQLMILYNPQRLQSSKRNCWMTKHDEDFDGTCRWHTLQSFTVSFAWRGKRKLVKILRGELQPAPNTSVVCREYIATSKLMSFAVNYIQPV
jgi:hypothetical protein